MKKNPLNVYLYEEKRINEYKNQFAELVDKLDTSLHNKLTLHKLFDWYGHARAIKSKAYQELKKIKK